MKICVDKECNYAGILQPKKNFWSDKKNKKDGLDRYCIECRKRRKMKYRKFPSNLAIRRRKLLERINKKYKLKD